MLPPWPPSPPEGPPRGTYFSRRNAIQPLPPLPAFTNILASSTNTRNSRPGDGYAVTRENDNISELQNSAMAERRPRTNAPRTQDFSTVAFHPHRDGGCLSLLPLLSESATSRGDAARSRCASDFH